MNEILTQEKSIYIQISEMIENDILRDILCEEERVPSTNELAKLYAINPATAAKGINILVEAGIVYKKRGIGMFVAKGAKEVIQKKRKDAFYQDYIASMLAEAQSLGITKQELEQMIMVGKYMENLICKNAGKSYKEKTVLKNVNLELEPGKIYGLIGRNGAGKTTLLSLMSAQNPVSGAGNR